jgi:hypothetical protein
MMKLARRFGCAETVITEQYTNLKEVIESVMDEAVQKPVRPDKIAEYEMFCEFLVLMKEGTLRRIECIFPIGTANHLSRFGTSATGFCQKPPSPQKSLGFP